MEVMNYYQPNAQQYDPNTYMYGYNPMGYANIPTPVNQNALTSEEMQILRNSRPNASQINLTVDRNDVIRSICTHKDENHRDVVQPINDGSGDVYCPICQVRWKPEMKSKEEIIDIVDQLLDQMQNAKWLGDLPTELTRDLFNMIPLLQKYPDIHEYAMNNFNKYYHANGVFNANDAGVYSAYNSLFGGGAYGPSQGYYAQQYYPQQGYYAQPMNPAMNMYQQQPMQPANPMVNPMQAPQGVPYGVNPMAPNQQFVQQANNMMGGSVYSQPQQGYYVQQMNPMGNQQTMNNPVFGTPQQPMNGPAQQQPVNGGTTPNGSTVTQQADGTVKSEKKIEL